MKKAYCKFHSPISQIMSHRPNSSALWKILSHLEIMSIYSTLLTCWTCFFSFMLHNLRLNLSWLRHPEILGHIANILANSSNPNPYPYLHIFSHPYWYLHILSHPYLYLDICSHSYRYLDICSHPYPYLDILRTEQFLKGQHTQKRKRGSQQGITKVTNRSPGDIITPSLLCLQAEQQMVQTTSATLVVQWCKDNHLPHSMPLATLPGSGFLSRKRIPSDFNSGLGCLS